MIEDEWRATAPGHAYAVFEAVVTSIGMVTFGSKLGGVLTDAIVRFGQKHLDTPLAERLDPKRDDALRNALPLIATISAFEAWAEDFTKSIMQLDPHCLENNFIQQRKFTMNDLLAPEDERLDVVYRAITAGLGRMRGVQRYEDLFDLTGLSEAVPPLIGEKFYLGQMVRHVWVHNAGTADAEFVSRTKHLGFQEGELVTVSFKPQLSEYMSAIIAYAMIVTNRHRKTCNLGPLPFGERPGKTPIGQAYNGLYQAIPQPDSDN